MGVSLHEDDVLSVPVGDRRGEGQQGGGQGYGSGDTHEAHRGLLRVHV